MPSQFIFIFSILFFSGASLAHGADPDPAAVAESAGWKGLLHYFDSDSSEISGGSPFFLSEKGQDDPRAELEETLQEFISPTRKIGPLQQDPLCAFPARREFLERVGFRFPKRECKDVDAFLEGLAPHGLTYVFSSAYPNNPASMFGHTLVRVNRRRDQRKSDPLLDYGVSFAANVPEGEIGIKYIPFGLLGLYSGALAIAPYYNKVLEYNSAESRDLWEYDLNFTPDESVFWTKHIWELRWLALFRYTFLTKNCSYQIIRSFQAIRPSLEDALPRNPMYVLPGDTVRQLAHAYPDLITGVHFRPSHFRVLSNRYDQLTGAQEDLYQSALGDSGKIAALTDRKVLETLNAHYEYEKIEAQEKVKPETEEFLRLVRVTRARLGGDSEFKASEFPELQTNRPDFAHGTRRIALTVEDGGLRGSEFGLKARLGLHELLNRDDGYESNFGIHGTDVEIVRNRDARRFLVKRIELFDMVSVQPVRRTHFPLSWRIFAGWRPIEERDDPMALKKEFQAGGGVGSVFCPMPQKIWLGFFVGATTHLDRAVRVRDREALTLEPYTLFRFAPGLKWRNSLEWQKNFHLDPGSRVFRSTLAWAVAREQELRVQGVSYLRTYHFQRKANVVGTELSWFF